MNVLSLFDGISCGQIALKRADIKVDNYFASEIDKYAIKVTQHNYPNTIQLGDVKEIDISKLPKIDLLIGGSPCQGFSFMGNQLNFNDPRSKLFFEYTRILKEIREINKNIYFLLENVKMKKEFEETITKALNVKPIKINSSLLSAQLRNRFYWTNIPNIQIPIDKNIKLQSILEKGAAPRDKSVTLLASYGDKTASTSGVRHYLTRSVGQLIPDITSITGYRKLSLVEACRLQTVPDNYFKFVDISDKEKYRELGNGWTVDVVAHIFKSLKNNF